MRMKLKPPHSQRCAGATESTPSPPSEGGEGRGEEARWFGHLGLPLSSLLLRGERKKKNGVEPFIETTKLFANGVRNARKEISTTDVADGRGSRENPVEHPVFIRVIRVIRGLSGSLSDAGVFLRFLPVKIDVVPFS